MTFDIADTLVGLLRGGEAKLVATGAGPPERVDGYAIGVVSSLGPPHSEMHPDGDEVLILVSGRLTVTLEERKGPRSVELLPGQGLIVPKGVWHQVVAEEPCKLIHVTPGPGGEHRSL